MLLTNNNVLGYRYPLDGACCEYTLHYVVCCLTNDTVLYCVFCLLPLFLLPLATYLQYTKASCQLLILLSFLTCLLHWLFSVAYCICLNTASCQLSNLCQPHCIAYYIFAIFTTSCHWAITLPHANGQLFWLL